jgi:predicted glycosyltransferase
MKSFALDDDDLVVTPVFGKFVSLADVIITPSPLAFEDRGPNRICHDSYHELAYLHPNRFVPNPAVLQEIGIKPGEAFFILRFNAFKAHHDSGALGLSIEQKLAIVELLKPYGKLFITTERDIEPELKSFQIPVSPDKIHSLMYYATMFIGDSQTMISEAALLGTPAIKLNSFAGRLSIPNEIEDNYHLCYSFLPQDFEAMLTKIRKLLETVDLKTEWGRRKAKMLADKIDLTTFLVEFVSDFPENFNRIKTEQTANTRFIKG